jgi:hypothetical protein
LEDRLHLARCYLGSEFPNILGSDDPVVIAAVENAVANLNEQRTWRLLEGLAQAYRANDMLALITGRSVDWYDVELPIPAITLTGMRPNFDAIMFSPAIGRDPLKFARYLNNYFERHPSVDDDPEDLNEFRRLGEDLRHPILFTREHRGKIGMLDGSHRLMALARTGTERVRVFAAVPNGRPERHFTGDAAFRMLKHLYKRYPKASDRQKIADVTIMLAKVSTDGKDSIQSYWIDHVRTPSVRQAGAELLRRLRRSNSNRD